MNNWGGAIKMRCEQFNNQISFVWGTEKRDWGEGETLGCEMHWQIARSGQGPLSFWRTIGVVRPRNWIALVLWMQSWTWGSCACGCGCGCDCCCSGSWCWCWCCWSAPSSSLGEHDAISMEPATTTTLFLCFHFQSCEREKRLKWMALLVHKRKKRIGQKWDINCMYIRGRAGGPIRKCQYCCCANVLRLVKLSFFLSLIAPPQLHVKPLWFFSSLEYTSSKYLLFFVLNICVIIASEKNIIVW